MRVHSYLEDMCRPEDAVVELHSGRGEGRTLVLCADPRELSEVVAADINLGWEGKCKLSGWVIETSAGQTIYFARPFELDKIRGREYDVVVLLGEACSRSRGVVDTLTPMMHQVGTTVYCVQLVHHTLVNNKNRG